MQTNNHINVEIKEIDVTKNAVKIPTPIDKKNCKHGFLRKPEVTENEDEIKPKLRGKIHRFGFYFNLILGIYLLYCAKTKSTLISLAVYLSSLLMLFGMSSVLHNTSWLNSKFERVIQKLDHANIFVLIAGFSPTFNSFFQSSTC